MTVYLSNMYEDEQDGNSNDEDNITDKNIDEYDFSVYWYVRGGRRGVFASVYYK